MGGATSTKETLILVGKEGGRGERDARASCVAGSCLPGGLELCGGAEVGGARGADTGEDKATLEQLGADALLLGSRGRGHRLGTHPHQHMYHAPLKLLPKWEEPGLTLGNEAVVSGLTSRHVAPPLVVRDTLGGWSQH